MKDVVEFVEEKPDVEVLSTETFAALLQTFDQTAQKKEVTKRTASKADRRKVWSQNIDSIPMELLLKVDSQMKSYVETYLLDRLDTSDGPKELTQDEVDRLAEEYLNWMDINDMIQARYKQFREVIFGSMDVKIERLNEEKKVQSETPPEQIPGGIESKKFGINFKREGGGRKSPSVHWQKLLDELGEEKFQELLCDPVEVEEQIIEAHTEYVPSGEKLMEALNNQKLGLEVVREALVPGSWTTPKFVIRQTKKKEE